MARITVRPIGIRNAGFAHCAICGSKRSAGHGTCINFCHWLLPGWMGWNAVLKEVAVKDHRALPLAAMHKYLPPTEKFPQGQIKAPSFPKLVAAARMLGWNGDTNAPSQPMFVEAQ